MRYVDDLGPPPPEFDDGGMIALALLILLAFCLAMAIAGCSFSLITLRYEQNKCETVTPQGEKVSCSGDYEGPDRSACGCRL